MTALLPAAIGLPVVLWGAGYAGVRHLCRATPVTAAAAAIPVMGLLHGYAAFTAARLTSHPAAWNGAFFMLAAGVATLGVWQAGREWAAIRAVTGVQLIVYGLLVLSLCALPVYAGAGWWGDWWFHYELAGRFAVPNADLHARIFDAFVPAGRPALLSWQMAAVRAILGDRYWAAQCVGMVFAAPLAGAVFLLVGDRLATRPAAVVAVLTCLLPGVWWGSTMLWPKVQPTAALLVGWAVARQASRQRRPPPLLTWVLFATAVLTHVLAVGYVAAAGIVLVWRAAGAGWRGGLRTTIAALACAAVVLGPWALWLTHTYSVADLQAESAYWDARLRTDAGSVAAPVGPAVELAARWGANLILSSVPARALLALTGGGYVPLQRAVLQGYLQSAFGLVMLSGLVPLAVSLRREGLRASSAACGAVLLCGCAALLVSSPEWCQPSSGHPMRELRPELLAARYAAFVVLLCAAAIAYAGRRGPNKRASPLFWWVFCGTQWPLLIQPGTWASGLLQSALMPTAVTLGMVALSRIARVPGARAWLLLLAVEAAGVVTWYLQALQNGASWTEDENLLLKAGQGATFVYDMFPLPPLLYGIAVIAVSTALLRTRRADPHSEPGIL